MTIFTDSANPAPRDLRGGGARSDVALASMLRGRRRTTGELPLHLQILRDELRASVARRLPWRASGI